MKNYNTIEWLIRRAEILVRDNFKCTKCSSDKFLHVHHIKYDNNLEPWEYPDEYLITLCNKCHEEFHNITPIGSMYEKITKYKLNKSLVKAYLKLLRT